MLLVAKNISKSYGKLAVLKSVDLSIAAAEIIAIVGASGAGKSTLLHLLGTLDNTDTGSIIFNGTDFTQLNDKALSAFRNQHMGFIFQFHHLLPEFTALENVCIPAYIAKENKADADARGLKLLTQLGLADRAEHKPSELSGGEQQRVAIARALINNPAIIFADEPTGNLDSNNANEINDLFLKIRKEMGVAIVIVTHNSALASIADRQLHMKDGNLIA
ncbi:MAG: ABC transporter ATP-binding protein [Sphingobacteriaceae bacterium]|jgi:lipoprotein-releasing system ATP-binding protein